jgi:hypothetical protein
MREAGLRRRKEMAKQGRDAFLKAAVMKAPSGRRPVGGDKLGRGNGCGDGSSRKIAVNSHLASVRELAQLDVLQVVEETLNKKNAIPTGQTTEAIRQKQAQEEEMSTQLNQYKKRVAELEAENQRLRQQNSVLGMELATILVEDLMDDPLVQFQTLQQVQVQSVPHAIAVPAITDENSTPCIEIVDNQQQPLTQEYCYLSQCGCGKNFYV